MQPNNACFGNTALVIEDDHLTATALARAVAQLGFEVSIAPTLAAARSIAQRCVPSLVIADLGMPDGDGAEVVRELKAAGPVDVLVISGTVEQAPVVESLRLGVQDFLIKPVKLSTVHRALNAIVEARRQRSIGSAVPASPVALDPARLVGTSSAAQALREQVDRVAGTLPMRALITGAPGVGKRNIAASLHRASGAPGQALCVNCAEEVDALTATRFYGREADAVQSVNGERQAELPGYFEMAAGGMVVLDDISRLPMSVQSSLKSFLGSGRLCRTGGLSERAVECSVVGILREPAEHALREGRLCEDLYYLLAAALIEVPSLSERDEDALELAERAVADLNRLTGTDKALSKDLRDRLRGYAWPGNVLELRNTLRNAYQGTGPDEEIEVNRVFAPALVQNPSEPVAHLVGSSFRQVEKKLLLATLEFTGGNKRQAARLLGISLKTLYNRLHAYQQSDIAS